MTQRHLPEIPGTHLLIREKEAQENEGGRRRRRIYSLGMICLLFLLPFAHRSGAQTLLPIPPHSNIYSGLVRGYWFTAPIAFTITGLKVSPEAGTTLQYIHVFKINDATPVLYPTLSTNITTLAYIQGATNNVTQTVSISVAAGDIIAILGAVGVNTDNSYSAAVTPYSTTIGGQAVSLGRIGYQGAITTSAAPNYFTESTGALSRVEMYYTTAPACTGSPNAPTITTATMTTPICPNATTTLAASNPSPPTGITYQWEQSASSAGPWASVTGGTGGTTLTYTTAALATTTWFRIKAICGTNNAVSTAFQVLVGGTPQPGTITGNATVCSGTSQTYSVAPVTGATSYTWTTPAGWNGTSTTNTLTASAGATGSISVTATGACGISTAQTLAVTASATPGQPGAITGNTTSCPGISQTYSIAAVPGATSYAWTLPVGWTAVSSTNSISTTAGTTGGAVTVTASNSCGTSPAQALAVTITNQAPVLSAITGNTSVCSGSNQTYTVPAVSGVLYYLWSLPGGWNGASTSNTIPAVVGAGSGNITVSANNGCGTSAPQSLAITVNPLLVPSVNITSTSNSICSGAPVTFNATATNGGATPFYQWKLNGLSVGTNSLSYSPVNLAAGDVVTLVMTGSAQCATTPAATSNALSISVNPNVVPGINVNATTPQVICSGTAVTFYSNINGGGTAPVYKWIKNGNTVGGNTPSYTDAALANGDSISCVLTTNAACATTPTAVSNKMRMTVLPILSPVATVTAYPGAVIAPGQQVIFSAAVSNGGSTPSYQWRKNGVDINGETGPTYTTNTLKNGDQVSLQLTSAAPCAIPFITGSNLVTVYYATGISTVNAGDIKLSLAPNPNSGHFTLTAEWEAGMIGKRARIEVLNTLGQMVYFTEVVPDRSLWHMDIDMKDGIANGLYMIRVTSEGKQLMKRFEVAR